MRWHSRLIGLQNAKNAKIFKYNKYKYECDECKYDKCKYKYKCDENKYNEYNVKCILTCACVYVYMTNNVCVYICDKKELRKCTCRFVDV